MRHGAMWRKAAGDCWDIFSDFCKHDTIDLNQIYYTNKQEFFGRGEPDNGESSINRIDDIGSAPMIKECPLKFLCKVCDTKAIRGFTMFFGDIVAAYANGDCIVNGKPDSIKIDPIIMMCMGYCNLENVVEQPFCEGKKLNIKAMGLEMREPRDRIFTNYAYRV